MLPDKLCFVDIETTGTGLTHDRIIEIGMLRVESGKLVNTYKSLIDPEIRIDPFIEQMTGIQTHELESAPTLYDIKDEILELLDGAVFVAHNVRFDYGFLRCEFKRIGTNFSSKHFCTVKLSRSLFHCDRFHMLQLYL